MVRLFAQQPKTSTYWCYSAILAALRVAAAPAEVAALLIDQQVAAVGTLSGHVLDPGGGRPGGGPFGDFLDFLLQHAGYGIGAREDGMSSLLDNGRAAYAPELLYDAGDLYSGTQRQRDEPGQTLQLR